MKKIRLYEWLAKGWFKLALLLIASVVIGLLILPVSAQDAKDTLAAFYEQAAPFENDGQYGSAIEIWSQCIEAHPEWVDPYGKRGELYVANSQFNEAIQDFNKAIALSPKTAKYYAGRAAAYAGLNDDVNVMADYSKAMGLESDPTGTYALGRGKIFMKQEQYPKAIADFTQVINLTDRTYRVEALTYRAQAYQKLGQYAASAADLKEAVALKQN